MSISCLSLAIKAKLCIFHTANNMRLHTTASRLGNFDYHNIATQRLENGYFSLKNTIFVMSIDTEFSAFHILNEKYKILGLEEAYK